MQRAVDLDRLVRDWIAAAIRNANRLHAGLYSKSCTTGNSYIGCLMFTCRTSCSSSHPFGAIEPSGSGWNILGANAVGAEEKAVVTTIKQNEDSIIQKINVGQKGCKKINSSDREE